MDFDFGPPPDPRPLLNAITEMKEIEIEGRKRKSWQTPWGVSFRDIGMGDHFWFYEYDRDIGGLTEMSQGAMSGGDVVKAIKQLSINPNMLRDKPDSIKYLERLTGQSAVRKHNGFGKWHLSKGNLYSMFNNVFGTSLGYCSSADDFEIWYMKKESEPREHQSVSDIEEQLRAYGYC